MAKQRKKAADEPAAAGGLAVATEPEPVQVGANKEKAIEESAVTLAKTLGDDPSKAVSSLLAQFEEMTRKNLELQKEIEGLRTTAGVQGKEDGGSRVVTGKAPDLELTKPAPATAETGEYAVFRSPFPGFKQVIRASNVIRHPNGDYHIEPPLMAEFTRGVCVLYDPDEIELMRKKLAQKTRKGEADFIEVTDPSIKKDAVKGQRVFVSDSVTADTPANALI